MKYNRFFLMLTVIALLPALLVGAQSVNDIPVTTASKEARDLFDKGLWYLDVARGIEARSAFLKATQLDPGFAHAYFYLSLAALSPEEFKTSLDNAAKNIEGKSLGEKLLVQINRTFLDNDAATRMKLARQLTQEYPQGPRAWMRLGFAHGSLNQDEDARKCFKKALELDPKLIGAHFALTFSYVFGESKDFDQAQKHMEAALRLSPDEAKVHELLGDVYRAKNQLEKARDAYTKALEKDPALSVASLKKGHINSFLGNFEQARADYDKGIAGAEEVNRINYANFKAFTYVHAGEPKQALEELERLVASADESDFPQDQTDAIKLNTLTNEITIALHNNLFQDAERILKQMRALTSQTTKRVGDQDFARQQNANLLLLEGQLAARKGDYAAAQQRAEESRQLVKEDQNPRKMEGYHALMGLVSLLQKKYPEAVEHFRKADQTNVYVEYQLALALEGSGSKQEAKKLFREVGQSNFNAVGFALVRKDALRRSA